MTNGYCTAEQVKTSMNIDDSADDVAVDRAIEAASRAIDWHCRRRFWTEDADATRYYTAASKGRVWLDGAPEDVEVRTVTTLKTDEDGDGTYGTTWAASDYRLEPVNAPTNGRPYSRIATKPQGSLVFPRWPAAVEIVGRFGWAAVPADVEEACIRFSGIVFKTVSEGAAPLVELGDARVMVSRYLDGHVEMMLRPFRRVLAR